MEGIYSVKMSWGKNKYDLEISTADSLEDLRAKVCSLTNVPPEGQKILFQGKQVTSDPDVRRITPGASLMLMGKAAEDKINLEVKEKVRFLEDMTIEEKNKLNLEKTGDPLPSGLINLGNTCYLNSTIQVLRRIPELTEAINASKTGLMSQLPQERLIYLFKLVFNQLKSKGASFAPKEFVIGFMGIFPQFSEREASGAFKQQDANECLNEILMSMSICLQENSKTGMQEEGLSVIDRLFTIKLKSTMTCVESEAEPKSVNVDTNRSLSCIIDNQGNPISNMVDGIRAGLLERIEKQSEVLGRSAIFEKKYEIDELPPYLFIQQVRFFWKEADIHSRTQASKAKIVRQVAFAKTLDLFEFCSDALKERLEEGRSLEKKKAEEKKKSDDSRYEEFTKEAANDPKLKLLTSSELHKKFKVITAEKDQKAHDEELWRPHGSGIQTGVYELIGVIVHKGRQADSGHYVGLTVHKGDEWYMYDDDRVASVPLQRVLDMNGGADSFNAYDCLYRRVDISKN